MVINIPEARENESPRCGAKTRDGTPCMAPVVPGKTRCRIHGGAPGSGAPIGTPTPLHTASTARSKGGSSSAWLGRGATSCVISVTIRLSRIGSFEPGLARTSDGQSSPPSTGSEAHEVVVTLPASSSSWRAGAACLFGTSLAGGGWLVCDDLSEPALLTLLATHVDFQFTVRLAELDPKSKAVIGRIRPSP